MDDRLARLESTLASLAEEVAALGERLARLEEGAPGRPAESISHPVAAALPVLHGNSVQHALALAGRTLVVLGGAYLLRALTESHVVPAPVGVALGLLYGAPWLFLARRAGAGGSYLDALCHATATALIGYPLVWEATTRFEVLSPPQSAALLAALTGAALLLAAAARLQGLAWVATSGALASAIGLAIATGDWASYAALATGVGIATLWLGYTREWIELRWPAAAVANLLVFIATGRAIIDAAVPVVLLLQFAMLVAYLGSFAVRTLVVGRRVIPFEVVQSAGVLLVGFGGAVYLVRSTGSSGLLIGVASLGLAALAYAVAFGFIERRRQRANLLVYTLLALVLTTAGIALCIGAAAASTVYAALGLVAAALGYRLRRLTLTLQAVLYALLAVVVSGLLSDASLAMLAPLATGWTVPSVLAMAALACLLAIVLLPPRESIERWPALASVLRLGLWSMLAYTGMGVAVAAATVLLSEAGTMDESVLASVRTAGLVGATLLVAAAARHPGDREAGWLTYPLLVLTGLKLLFVDFPEGRPATLFVALALYGCALIAAPRLLRRPTREIPEQMAGREPQREAVARVTATSGPPH